MVEAYKINQKRLDSRTALLCASVYNANRTKKDKLVKPEVFMPKEGDSKGKTSKKQTPEDMLLMAELWTAVAGGIDKRKGVATNDDIS